VSTAIVQLVHDTLLRIGDLIDVTTERLAYGGDAIARHDGLAIFVPYAAAGERLRVRITERKKNFARGVIDRILEASSSRRAPRCQYFGDCGGCQLQHITYEAQLESKSGFVRDALQRIGRIDWPYEIEIRHGAEFGYRSRAQVKVDQRAGRVGFNRAASNAVCDVASCPILVPELDQALHSLWAVLGRETNKRHAPPNRLQVDMAAGDSGVSFEPAPEGLPGGALRRTVNHAVYSFSASTFFQGNASLLDQLVNEAIGESSGELAIDLYAGVGLFTVQLAQRFTRVIGVEAEGNTANFARRNISANQVENVEFHNSRTEAWLKQFAEAGATPPDLILLDPPRTGAAECIAYIVAVRPTRITYVSCDPTTLARDLRQLIDSGYGISRISAIDLFPQTYHVEAVAQLERR
jgi:23S rRNA (uracil1939-C5)-methyltransferase